MQVDPNGAPNQNEIALSNKMPEGDITALLRLNNWAVAQTGPLAPGEAALFMLEETLFATVGKGKVSKGRALTADSFVADPTPLVLLGVQSATIAWVETGSTVEPFAFELTDIKTA